MQNMLLFIFILVGQKDYPLPFSNSSQLFVVEYSLAEWADIHSWFLTLSNRVKSPMGINP